MRIPMAYTEQNIRRLALGFLRQHYKFRPRSATSGTRVVDKPHFYKGVIIDARLAFQKPNLDWFIATIEATGLEERHEIEYRVNVARICVHAGIITLTGMAIFLALTLVQGESVWQWFGRPDVYYFLAYVFVLSFVGTALLLSTLKYYRYIYAVAQFMRFYADAQWIAYDAAIFEGDDHARRKARKFRELQRQCVRFGFGLIEIREGHAPVSRLEPSQIDQFGGSRGALPAWVAAIEAPPIVRDLTKRLPGGKKTPAPVEEAPPEEEMQDPLAIGTYLPVEQRQEEFLENMVPAKRGRKRRIYTPAKLLADLRWRWRRFVRLLYPRDAKRLPGYYELPYWVMTLAVVSFLSTAFLLYEHSRWEPLATPGEKTAAPSLAPLEPAADPSRSDAEPGVLPGEYDHTLTAAEAREDLDDGPLRSADPIVEVIEEEETDIFRYRIRSDGEIFIDYECVSLFPGDSLDYFLVEYGRFPSFIASRDRAQNLHDRYGIGTMVWRTDCFEPTAPGYSILLGEPLAVEGDANFMVRQYRSSFGLEAEVIPVAGGR
ncbi:hypothetical protein [Lewinella sp. W8]|uniref:hypothetical protein n=1 Tax=Lewinella sp. W8 TaxID=2528208 RepID=UPI001067D6EA|nr:hypothetical protein [Lewinella sp. W8]MTB51418.1 hypothetical protein [Lewinella sp. W8]